LFLPFSRSGLLTPEPDENLLNSAFSPGKAAQGCSSLLPQMIGGKQSHVEQPFAVGATMARVPTPRPSDAGVIMVKPYRGEGNAFLHIQRWLAYRSFTSKQNCKKKPVFDNAVYKLELKWKEPPLCKL